MKVPSTWIVPLSNGNSLINNDGNSMPLGSKISAYQKENNDADEFHSTVITLVILLVAYVLVTASAVCFIRRRKSKNISERINCYRI